MNERSSQRDHEQEQQAVREAVLDYVEGVYEADPSRIERSVHHDLAKRGFFIEHGQSTESIMSFTQFLEHTKSYNKNDQFPPDAPKEILIYEVRDHTASVKTYSSLGHRLHAPGEVQRQMDDCACVMADTPSGSRMI